MDNKIKSYIKYYLIAFLMRKKSNPFVDPSSYTKSIFDRNMLVSRTNKTGFDVTVSSVSHTKAIKKAKQFHSMGPFSDFH